MKVSRVLTMKNLYTGENEEVKLDTKEIREFNFLKNTYVINKIFMDNIWLKILLLTWVLSLIILLIFEKNGQNYEFLVMLIFASLMTITLATNFNIAKLYFLGKENDTKKRLTASWDWGSAEKVKLYKKNNESSSFLKRAMMEINKLAIRFYLSNLAVGLATLFMAALLIAEDQPDKISLIFFTGIWVLMEFYLYMLRRFIRAKAKGNYDVTLRVDDSTKENTILEARFSLNGNYIIEEEKSSFQNALKPQLVK